MSPQEILKQYFGYDDFRPGQQVIIDAIMDGRDALAVMPTGAGKSICYQVPAMLLPGVTLVISPLISLMQDQVKALNAAGIHASYINSSLSENQISRALGLAAMGAYKIMYVAPERLTSHAFLQFASIADISMVTVDEAHCISQWGQDFRPSYLKIIDFIRTLSKRPILSAFTATATEEVKEDIRCILGLQNPEMLVTGFDRPNLYFEVDRVRKKDDYVLNYLREHPKDSGIIYCATRKNVDNLFELLFKSGISVTRYHAGMASEERKYNQDNFVYDRTTVMVATNAFGMGIDKSNVRFVIHYNMPQSMENYYQEAGRAGRDGEDSRCILLYSPQDTMTCRMLLERKDFSAVDPMDIENIRHRDNQRLRIMENYCQTTDCLRNFILNYFGESTEGPCHNCANCERTFEEEDMTKEAKWIINCIAETRGRYGASIITGTLVGANRARLREIGADSLRSYGKLKETHEEALKSLIQEMLRREFLVQTDGVYGILKLGPHAMDLKDESVQVTVKSYTKPSEKSAGSGRTRRTDDLTSLGFQLFESLRELRMQIAQASNLPPYIIFTDKTLIDMCLKLPMDRDSMLNVSGVAAAKYERYGEQFLDVIRSFIEAHPGQVISTYTPSVSEDSDSSTKKSRKTKTPKEDFRLTPEAAASFPFKDIYFMSEIREILNELCQDDTRKKVTNVQMERLLEEAGYTKTVFSGSSGNNYRLPTELGLASGIETEERTAKSGRVYEVMKYGENMQRIILDLLMK